MLKSWIHLAAAFSLSLFCQAIAQDPCVEDDIPCQWSSCEYLCWFPKSDQAHTLLIKGHYPKVLGPFYSTPPLPPTAPGFISYYTVNGEFNRLNIHNATGTLYGSNIHKSIQSGARLTFGTLIDSDKALEAVYFLLPPSTNRFKKSAKNYPVLGIPYYDVEKQIESSYLIAQPSVSLETQTFVNTTPGVYVYLYSNILTTEYSGVISIDASSFTQGLELNEAWRLNCAGEMIGQPEIFGGVKFLELKEKLTLRSDVESNISDMTVLDPFLEVPNPQTGTTISSKIKRKDEFSTSNYFAGAQIGVRGKLHYCRYFCSGSLQGALGCTREHLKTNGKCRYSITTTTIPSETTLLAGIPISIGTGDPAVVTTSTGSISNGLFVQPSNKTQRSRMQLGALIQGEFKVGANIGNQCKCSLGYAFLFLNSVVRPGGLINNSINSDFLKIPQQGRHRHKQPKLYFNSSNYWIQGLVADLTYFF